MLEEDGLNSFLDAARDMPAPVMMDRLLETLQAHTKTSDFGDDVSILVFDYDGPCA